MMHTEIHCTDLDRLDRTKAIRAIHEAFLQLRAVDRNVDCSPYDNSDALASLERCLRDIGHPAGMGV